MQGVTRILISLFIYSAPVDMQSYELCCDMIDVVIDVSCIYGYAYIIMYTSLRY